MDHWIKLFIAQLYLLLAIGVFYRYHVHHDLAKTCVFRWYIAKSELQTINSWRQRHVLSDNKTVDTGANLSFFATKCTFFTRYFPSIQGQMPSLSSELQVFSVSRGRKRISHSSHLISLLLAGQIFFFFLIFPDYILAKPIFSHEFCPVSLWLLSKQNQKQKLFVLLVSWKSKQTGHAWALAIAC